jgi:hypothetical protein
MKPYQELSAVVSTVFEANIYKDGVRINFGERPGANSELANFHSAVFIPAGAFPDFATLINKAAVKLDSWEEPDAV